MTKLLSKTSHKKEKSAEAVTSKKASQLKQSLSENLDAVLLDNVEEEEEEEEEDDQLIDVSHFFSESEGTSLNNEDVSFDELNTNFYPPALHKNKNSLALLPKQTSPSIRDPLQLYLREISKFTMLSPEEEVRLTHEFKETGDPNIAFRLVSSHLRLVVRVAMDFQRKWMQNVLDLIQEGNVGLIKAVEKFDPEKGIKFSYYATFWIKAYILKFIMDNWRMVKVGTTQAQRKLFYNLNKERQLLTQQGFEPDVETLAKRLEVSKEQVVEMEQRLDGFDVSLNAPVNDDDSHSSSKMEYLPALGPGIEETLNNKELSSIIHEKLLSLEPNLSDKEKYILHARLLADDPVTLREIGEHYDITRERVRQIEARLLQKVRDHLFLNIKDFSHEWVNS